MTEDQSRYFDLGIKVIAIIGAIFSFFFGLHRYEVLRADESAKMFWEKQFPIYEQICTSAATIATSSDQKEIKLNEEKFWNLYYGSGRVVIDKKVHAQLSRFASKLKDFEAGLLKQSELTADVYSLSMTCRESLAYSWNNPLSNFEKESNKY